MNILAIDQATKTGWATNQASGVWDLSIRRDESGGMRLIRLSSKLKELHELTPIDLVVYERVSGRFKNAISVSAELAGVIKLFAEQNDIEYRAYSALEIKKFATGKGNANKPMMVKAAEEKFGIMIIDDNHADALWLHELAKSDYGEVQKIVS